MRAGAAFAVVYGVVFGLFRHALVPGMVSGVFVSLLWLWMAWKNEAGRNWARVLSSVFFGFQCPGLLFSVIDGNWSLALLAALIEWGIGLAALILLWRPESGQFFAAARQARLTAAPVAPYRDAAHPAGTQGAGYGQPAEAIPLYERTLTDREQVLGATHPDTLTSRNNLALAYRAAGRPTEAEDPQKRAERES